MSKVDDKQIAVARVYSRAMYDLAKSRGVAEQLLDELQEIANLIARDEAFAAFVASPMVDAEERAASLEKLFRGKASDLLVDSLQVIHRKERLALLPAISEAFRLEHQEQLGRVDVRIRTAVALTDRLRDDLRRAITQRYGKEPALHEEVDSSLIGGMVLQVDDEKVDSSVVRQIAKMRHTLHERAATEIHRSRREQAEQAAG
ncbi:MAG: ATP synthase F1 subunit delta [Acidobacteriota bacterium]